MQEAEKVRELLPQEVRGLFDDITMGRVLGAGSHIRMIGTMMEAVAGMELTDSGKMDRCLAVGEFFKETRGKSSYAVISAVNLMTKGFGPCGQGEGEACIKASISRYFEKSDRDTKQIMKYFRRLVHNRGMRTIMAYDYSSTVEKCITGLGEPLVVYVPESRAIDGGRPFAKAFAEAGHQVCFIPDAAMLTVLGQVDGVFIGAETFYPDGSAFNTVGSDILAELCRYRNVPFYVLTPLLKVDMRPCQGIFKEIIAADLGDLLAGTWEKEIREAVDFYSIELVQIPAETIDSFVTEEGIIPAVSLFQIAREFHQKINSGGTDR